MKKQTNVPQRTRSFRLFFALLFTACLSQIVRANDFEILYHEPLDFQFESSASEDSGQLTQAVKATAKSKQEVLSFDAFGKHFELLLESNNRLIAKLPESQQESLKKHMRLFSGRISGVNGSWVRISFEDNRISGVIWDGEEMYIIDNESTVAKALGPSNADSQSSQPLIYRLSETVSGARHCGTDSSGRPLNDYLGLIKELNNEDLAPATSQLDVAVVADAQFTRNKANPSAEVVARMNVVDGIFSEQVGVQINLSEIQTLQNSNGLSSSNASTLLGQFRNFVGSAGFNNPGLAHLFTGRDMDGSTIGIAYIDALCRRTGIGISQTRGSGTAGALTVAHEMGHNFGAPHDNQSSSACARTPGNFLMNPRLNGSDQFSQCSITQMQSSIRNASCITAVSPQPPTPPGPVDPTACTVDENFEAGSVGWVPSSASTCATGDFVLGTPSRRGVRRQGKTSLLTQVRGDHTRGNGNAWFTAFNSKRSTDDVDAGTCVLDSPVWRVNEDSNLSLWYFHGQRDSNDDSGDFFALDISTDGGVTFKPLVSIGDTQTNAEWTQATMPIRAGSNVMISLRVADGPRKGDIIEGGLDDIRICPTN